MVVANRLLAIGVIVAVAVLGNRYRVAEEELMQLYQAREREALDQLARLERLLPICASCKKIRDDEDNWHQVEVYVRDKYDAEFSHGICPDCSQRLYGEVLNDE